MKLRRKLFASKDPYDVSKSDLFLRASKENFNYLLNLLFYEDYHGNQLDLDKKHIHI